MRTIFRFSSLILCLLLVSCTALTAAPIQTPMPTETIKPLPNIIPTATQIPKQPSLNLNQPELTAKPNWIEGMVDIGGRSSYIKCIGTGSPTIVLDFGSGWTLDDLLNPLSDTTRVCEYNQAYSGKNTPAPKSLIAKNMMNDKHTVLGNAQIQGPYVLVSFSIATWIDLLYAQEYPSEVAGMVFLMGWHPELLSRMSAVESSSVALETTKETPNTFSLDEWYILDPFEVGKWDLTGSSEQVAMMTSLGDIPLQVLTTGFKYPSIGSFPPRKVEAWNMMQQELADLSKNGKLVVVPDSTIGLIFSYSFVPEIYDAISQVVKDAQTAQP